MSSVYFDEPLIIDWAQTNFNNTVMAIAAGASLMIIASIMADLKRGTNPKPFGWAINLGIVGLITFATGLHTTLTWSFGARFAHDNIIFGEPVLMLGSILLGLSLYFAKNSKEITKAKYPTSLIASDLSYLRFLLYGAGGSLIAIAIAALQWNLFIAPVEEPLVAVTTQNNLQWLTNIPMALLFASIGVCALLVPGMLAHHAGPKAKVTTIDNYVMTALKILGLALIIIGAIVTYTHIGMIINTSEVIPHN